MTNHWKNPSRSKCAVPTATSPSPADATPPRPAPGRSLVLLFDPDDHDWKAQTIENPVNADVTDSTA